MQLLWLGLMFVADLAYGSKCPGEFDDLPGVNMCVLHVPVDATFADARKNCHSLDADLASFITAEEQEAMVNYLMAPPFSKDGARREKGLFWWHWLDATNDNPQKEWRWSIKGKEIPLSETATFWDYEEPTKSISCLVMQSGRFGFDRYWRHWRTYDCLQKRPYICQIRYSDNNI